MRTIFKILPFILTILIFIGCSSEDACESITCLNEGECIDGTCECTLGYEGETCEIESIAKFVGNYELASETCGNFEAGFEIVEVENSVIDLTIIIQSNNGGTFEDDLTLTTATSFSNGSGSVTGTYSEESIVLTIGGCEGTYSKQ